MTTKGQAISRSDLEERRKLAIDIETALDELKLSCRQFARLMGVSVETVRNWVNMGLKPSSQHYARVMEELGLAPNDYFGVSSKDAMCQELGATIAAARCEKGLSIQATADLCGITYISLKNFENGRRVPGTKTLKALCAALGLDEVQLLALREQAMQA